jgi:hypothetical protein
MKGIQAVLEELESKARCPLIPNLDNLPPRFGQRARVPYRCGPGSRTGDSHDKSSE